MTRCLLALWLFLASASLAFAHPPGTDPNSPEGQWSKCQRQPDADAPCCGVGDEQVLEGDDWRPQIDRTKLTEFPYQFRYEGRWFDIPAKKVIRLVNCGPEPDVQSRDKAKVWFYVVRPLAGPPEAIPYCFITGVLS